jgi:hypothetical protein
MACLSADEVLRLCESAAAQPPVERALTILAAADPGTSRAELARLSIGERDARLLDVREATFGASAAAAAACTHCGERVEFTLSLAQLRAPRAAAPADELRADGLTLRFRVPDSDDVSAAQASPDPRGMLVARCLLDARRDGSPVAPAELPPSAVARLAAAIAASDPQAEVLLDYACPACGRSGQTLFDVAAFLWEELRAHARRLLFEVAALARGFGWREADILAMSAARRRAYLELLS